MGKSECTKIKSVVLSLLAEQQRKEYVTRYGDEVVTKIVEGMLWVVAHNPFIDATPLPNNPGRFLIETYTDTTPIFNLVYVFKDADNQREIYKFRLCEI